MPDMNANLSDTGTTAPVRRGDPPPAHALQAEFDRAFGAAPAHAAGSRCVRVVLLETPLGPMLAAATHAAVCRLEFAELGGLERSRAEMQRQFALPIAPGTNAVLEQLGEELREYMRGVRRGFSVPIEMRGTEFQRRVWSELRRIPHGQTTSYEGVAQRIGSPSAARAVARANASNCLCLLVPCHRVIAKNGALSGYSGGVWRKPLLIALERTGRLPEHAS